MESSLVQRLRYAIEWNESKRNYCRREGRHRDAAHHAGVIEALELQIHNLLGAST